MSKTWTDAERKAFGEKMKQAKLNKLKEQPAPPQAQEEVVTDVQNDDYNTLKQQVEELKQLIANQAKQQPAPQPQGAQITATGLIGTLHKYNTDPSYYPDFTKRLALEPRLSRFAFGENWELEFSVKTSAYTTLDNRRVDEPQFTIQLIGVVFDDDGNKTDGRYVKKQMIFFEDPDAALAVARENALDVKDFEEKTFLDEMRYIRVKNWLLENFYPPTNTNKKQNKKQMVVGNQVVDYYEISSVEGSAMPFNQLGNKIKG